MFKDNPAYQLVAEHENTRIYLPANIMEGYHQKRFAEAINQNIYASSGTTPDVINTVCDEVILRCNKKQDTDTMLTDIAALMQSLKYRTRYPVDQHCLLRMGAILSFMEYDEDGKTYSEDPNDCQDLWINKKVSLAMRVPDMYAFFLSWGQSNTPSYEAHLNTLKDSGYLQARMEALKGILPDYLWHLTGLYSL